MLQSPPFAGFTSKLGPTSFMLLLPSVTFKCELRGKKKKKSPKNPSKIIELNEYFVRFENAVLHNNLVRILQPSRHFLLDVVLLPHLGLVWKTEEMFT